MNKLFSVLIFLSFSAFESVNFAHYKNKLEINLFIVEISDLFQEAYQSKVLGDKFIVLSIRRFS